MNLKIFIAILLVIVIGFAVYSSVTKNAFAPTEYLPREALVYVQTNDLPQFIKIWNESKFKEKYLNSQNFTDLKNRHLGRKLTSRWSEFVTAVGFPIDLETISALAEKQAAVAIYDIGKLEFVFIAPMNEQIFAATKFAQNQDKFTIEALEDGTNIYRVSVEADRGRQKQELIFTYLKDHFVLTTSQKLLVQTLDNFNSKSRKNRLFDEPSFSALRSQIEPHTATVWVNQTALNDDYYFKRYWLMSEIKNLKNIRAGIFDFEIQAGKLLEHRKFLLNQTSNVPTIKPSQAEEILSMVPEKVPFYRLQATNGKTINEAIRRTIFEKHEESVTPNSHNSYDYFDSGYDESDWRDYEYLDEDFDENIDEVKEDEQVSVTTKETDFSNLLQPAYPSAVIHFSEPNVLPAPMFIEFKRASIFVLGSPKQFNRSNFEAEIEKNLADQILISTPVTNLVWETKNENGLTWRELNLPMLSWKVSYTVRGNNLILTNNSDLLRDILTHQEASKIEKPADNFSEMTVLNLSEREAAFDRVFAEFSQKKIADEFFTKNIGSLLDSVSEVERIELTRRFSNNLMEENLRVILKTSASE